MSTRPSRPFLAAALAALAVLALPPGAAAQSPPAGAATNCEPPARLSPTGAATCADPAARLADRRRAQAYAALRDQLAPAQRPGLEENARAFETFLAATCATPVPDADCLARFHAAKREDLRRWLTPPAREEADRDPAEAAALERRLAGRGLPNDPAPRREAIAALQREAGLPPSGFLDAATAALIQSAEPPPRPAPPGQAATPEAAPEAAPEPAQGTAEATGPGEPLPAGAFWSSFIPTRLGEHFAITGCAEPTASWSGRGLWVGGRPVPGETSYEIFGQEDPAGDRVFLVPPGGRPRILRLLPDGTIRLEGVVPRALAERGLAPGAILRPCGPDPRGAALPAAATDAAALPPGPPPASEPPAAAGQAGTAELSMDATSTGQTSTGQTSTSQANAGEPSSQPDTHPAAFLPVPPPPPSEPGAPRASAPSSGRAATRAAAPAARRGARAAQGRAAAPKSRPSSRPAPRSQPPRR